MVTVTPIYKPLLCTTGVGKSSLLRAFAQLPVAIIGGNRVSRFVDIEDRRCELEVYYVHHRPKRQLFATRSPYIHFLFVKQVWNAPELRRFGHIPPSYCRNMDGVILVYDVTDSAFPIKIRNWMELLRKVLLVCFLVYTAGLFS